MNFVYLTFAEYELARMRATVCAPCQVLWRRALYESSRTDQRPLIHASRTSRCWPRVDLFVWPYSPCLFNFDFRRAENLNRASSAKGEGLVCCQLFFGSLIMKLLIAFLAIYIIAGICGSTAAQRPSRVVPLTVKNYEKETATGTWVVELCALFDGHCGCLTCYFSYAPWCNHCQEYAKTYDQASLEVSALKFGKVDCVAEKGIVLTTYN